MEDRAKHLVLEPKERSGLEVSVVRLQDHGMVGLSSGWAELWGWKTARLLRRTSIGNIYASSCHIHSSTCCNHLNLPPSLEASGRQHTGGRDPLVQADSPNMLGQAQKPHEEGRLQAGSP